MLPTLPKVIIGRVTGYLHGWYHKASQGLVPWIYHPPPYLADSTEPMHSAVEMDVSILASPASSSDGSTFSDGEFAAHARPQRMSPRLHGDADDATPPVIDSSRTGSAERGGTGSAGKESGSAKKGAGTKRHKSSSSAAAAASASAAPFCISLLEDDDDGDEGMGNGAGDRSHDEDGDRKPAAVSVSPPADDDDVEVVAPVAAALEPALGGCGNATSSSASNKRGRADDDDDDEIVVLGATNVTRLPHMHQHCTECRFVPDVGLKCVLAKHASDLTADETCCSLCYCYVCDVPASSCAKWKSTSDPTKHWSSLPHCLASNGGRDGKKWINLRQAEKKRWRVRGGGGADASSSSAGPSGNTRSAGRGRRRSTSSRATTRRRSPSTGVTPTAGATSEKKGRVTGKNESNSKATKGSGSKTVVAKSLTARKSSAKYPHLS